MSIPEQDEIIINLKILSKVDKNRKLIYKLANSKNLWEKRIAILTTFTFIRNNDFKDTLKICKILLKDEHDLTHKAMGWMLREIWKRNNSVTEKFLIKKDTRVKKIANLFINLFFIFSNFFTF